jgi:hypothetical protein
MPASAEAAKPPAPATLAAPAEFKQRADELVLIFNGERQPSASFSQLALEKGKISAKQLDERLGKFTGQARDKFGRVDGIVEVLAVGPHEAIVVLSGKKEELPVRLTLEPAPPYGIVGIGAGPAVNLEAALRREMAAAGGSASQP